MFTATACLRRGVAADASDFVRRQRTLRGFRRGGVSTGILQIIRR
jgi:hypothetical protein